MKSLKATRTFFVLMILSASFGTNAFAESSQDESSTPRRISWLKKAGRCTGALAMFGISVGAGAVQAVTGWAGQDENHPMNELSEAALERAHELLDEEGR